MRGSKGALRGWLLAAAVASLAFGLWRGEGAVVLQKAVNLCFECVGLG